ncbi:response regulator [Sinorhizobium garamanticum]|uniref:Response regulator n=1 Tax=Sinorhizobium garamanticum TaxID=680247 RepID=A0ABY8D4G7_9HYPH|nr:response regulator [Sinorhizobium garamanticum]WEX85756.1 response regulator [Sinorhizobium garamanticum]
MLRVLLVEDEWLIATCTCSALEHAGYHVTLAGDGQAGLEIVQREAPQFIITDYMMPRMDGMTMIRLVREHGYAGPIILITATPEHDLPERWFYDAYMPKPCKDEDLLAMMSTCATQRRS